MPAHRTWHASAQRGSRNRAAATSLGMSAPSSTIATYYGRTLWKQAIHFSLSLGDATPYERRREKPNLAGLPEWGQCVCRSSGSIGMIQTMRVRFDPIPSQPHSAVHWA